MINPSSQDPDLQRYFAEIGQTPLLDAEQERALGRRVQRGSASAQGDFIKANLLLVVHVARQWFRSGLPLADLIAEGNLGLILAVQKFDPDAGCRFSTYAVWWIRQAISRAVHRQGRGLRLPSAMQLRVKHWKRARCSLKEQLGRPPTSVEVADELALTKVMTRNVGLALAASKRHHASLSGDVNGLEWADTLISRDAPQPVESVGSQEELERLGQCLGMLDVETREVLAKRFGLDGEDAHTLKQLGQRMGLSGEGVRQVIRRALEVLRSALKAPMAEAA